MGIKYQDGCGIWWHEVPCGARYRLYLRICKVCGKEEFVDKRNSIKERCQSCAHTKYFDNKPAGNYYDEKEKRWYYWNPAGHRAKLYERICDGCGVSDLVRKELLNNLCYSCANVKDKNPMWKGGEWKSRSRKYIYIYKPEHPYCNGSGYIAEHRLVMEEKLGRYLESEEVVHHVNGIRDDNRPENLWLFSSVAEHQKWHWWLYKREKIY